jgi:hypothetical protein
MLKKQYLFELIKSLDIHEKRYLVAKGRKAEDDGSAYVKIIQGIYAMPKYTEDEIKKIIFEHSESNKTDVKKHYLYYWILNHLFEYHAEQYDSFKDLSYIMLLKDRSLFGHAQVLIPKIKQQLKEKERYAELFLLLENELKISSYLKQVEPVQILEELSDYSKQYRDYTIFETLKFQFRKILDSKMFMREDEDKIRVEEILSHPFLDKKYKTEGVMNRYNYNLLNYWASAHTNNWEKAYEHAKNNFKHMSSKKSYMLNFPEQYLYSLYNFINAQTLTGRQNNSVVIELKNLMKTRLNSRIKNDAYFYFNLSKLIRQNKNPGTAYGQEIEAAENYIIKNEQHFSRISINQFYFDLAKCFFNSGNIKKAFSYFNEIYQHLNIKGHTLDFYFHSRLLFCICCFELSEIELMINSAKSTFEFVKRNKLLYGFEKRILKFLINELPKTLQDKSLKLRLFKKLSSELEIIFKSEYEKSVINYFDYKLWVDEKIIQLEPLNKI